MTPFITGGAGFLLAVLWLDLGPVMPATTAAIVAEPARLQLAW